MQTARTTTRNGIAAVRCHPAGSLFLTALLASAIVCYALFVSVPIQLVPLPPAPGALPAFGQPVTGSAHGQRRGAVSRGSGQPVSGPAPSSAPAAAASAYSPGSASDGPSPAGPSQLAASPVPLSPSSPVPSPSPSPGPPGASATPSPPATNPGGLCVDVGPLGVCLAS
jgi:hypothetical protein